MTKRNVLPLLLTIALSTGASLRAAERDQGQDRDIIKRYAVVLGANDGGKGRVRLRYAVSDARAMSKVLEELGGVLSEDNLLLLDPDVKTFYSEMGKLQARMEKARPEHSRVEVLFYYSGHSDDGSILLGNEKISYKDFRHTISGMPADVRIAILDSCLSGSFTRLKGGKMRRPFMVDEAYDMKGYAFMSSSSATEASQESDLIEGSYFTHYLISGIRGAADMTQDGRVTLSEAYQFTFNETLAETAKTRAGPQHPYYDIEMSGTGDVVMTDVRKGSAILVLEAELSGRIFIHDRNNSLVVELTKPLGRRIELGLETGEYRVINLLEDQVFESRVRLENGFDFRLRADGFSRSEKAYTTPRGDRIVQLRKETLIPDHHVAYFGELSSKITRLNNAPCLLMGGGFGWTFGNVFSLGLAGFGKVNQAGGGPGMPGYGALTLAYIFDPEKKMHWRITAHVGAGSARGGYIFYMIEPGAEMILNLSRTVRIQFGASFPITDNGEQTGLKSPAFNLGLQFGI